MKRNKNKQDYSKRNTKKVFAVGCILVLVLIAACSKSEGPGPNPYDDPTIQAPEETEIIDTTTVVAHSLEALHLNIFKPTCANSGCHDGTFEPDFRTLESTYNTTVNKQAIKTDPGVPIGYRVLPFQPDQSMLYYRLLNFLPNTSGIMPLESNDSDWDENKDAYINNLRTWIENGATDVF